MSARAHEALMSAKLAGCYVSPHVVRALASTFPEVRLVWNYHYKRWVMVQRLRDGSYEPFRMLGTKDRYEQPSMANTVKVLARYARIRTKLDRQQFLDELDATSPSIPVEKRALEKAAEGAKEMSRYALGDRTAVRIPWATRSPLPS